MTWSHDKYNIDQWIKQITYNLIANFSSTFWINVNCIKIILIFMWFYNPPQNNTKLIKKNCFKSILCKLYLLFLFKGIKNTNLNLFLDINSE